MVMPRFCFMNEEDFTEPSEFRPERFMDGDKFTVGDIDPREFAFGFGRR